MIHAVVLLARQELLLATRSRSTQIFASVFAVLALAVAASGYIISGGSGMQDFARTSASLLQLVILIVPLASLVIGVLSVGADRGYAEVLFLDRRATDGGDATLAAHGLLSHVGINPSQADAQKYDSES